MFGDNGSEKELHIGQLVTHRYSPLPDSFIAFTDLYDSSVRKDKYVSIRLGVMQTGLDGALLHKQKTVNLCISSRSASVLCD